MSTLLSNLKPKPPFAFRNKIINGDMTVAQRYHPWSSGSSLNFINGTSNLDQVERGLNSTTITTAAAGVFVENTTVCVIPDRWVTNFGRPSALNNPAALSAVVKQSVDVPAGEGFLYSYHLTNTTPAGSLDSRSNSNYSDSCILYQTIEGYNVTDLAYGTTSPKDVTISFWVKCTYGGTYAGTWVVYPAIDSTTGSPVTSVETGQEVQILSYPFNYTVNSANTWEYKTIKIPGPVNIRPGGGSAIENPYSKNELGMTGNNRGCALFFALGMGTLSYYNNSIAPINAWTSDTKEVIRTAQEPGYPMWQLNGEFFITGVQVEANVRATEFEHQEIHTTLKQCQRYYLDIGGSYNTDNSGNFIRYVTSAPVPLRTNDPYVRGEPYPSDSSFEPDYTGAYKNSYYVAHTSGYGVSNSSRSSHLRKVDAEFVPWVNTSGNGVNGNHKNLPFP